MSSVDDLEGIEATSRAVDHLVYGSAAAAPYTVGSLELGEVDRVAAVGIAGRGSGGGRIRGGGWGKRERDG